MTGRGAGRAVLFLWACSAPAAGPGLDTSCPAAARSAEALLAEIGRRGIEGPPESVELRPGGYRVLVAWKNLLSGRELTLSCAYRPADEGWSLVRRRLDEGTHTIRLAATDQPPLLVYRDVRGRVLEELSPAAWPPTP